MWTAQGRLISPRRPLLALAAFATTLGVFAADFAIRDGDRVVFLGDSITEQRLYTTYIEAYALTRHPDWKLGFRNVGWGGDTAWLRQRAHPDEGRLFAAEGEALDGMVTNAVARGLGRDVLPHRPTFVTVKFGMNDHSYQKFRPDIFRAYARSQAEISRELQAAGARVTFLTPQPIEERRPDPDKDDRNLSLRQFSDGLKDVAAQNGAGFVDHNKVVGKATDVARDMRGEGADEQEPRGVDVAPHKRQVPGELAVEEIWASEPFVREHSRATVVRNPSMARQAGWSFCRRSTEMGFGRKWARVPS
jgi:lysophospholipase L1-like esterase